MFYIEVSGMKGKNIDLFQKIIRIKSSFILQKKLSPFPAKIEKSEINLGVSRGNPRNDFKEERQGTGFQDRQPCGYGNPRTKETQENVLNIKISNGNHQKIQRRDCFLQETPDFRQRGIQENKENNSNYLNVQGNFLEASKIQKIHQNSNPTEAKANQNSLNGTQHAQLPFYPPSCSSALENCFPVRKQYQKPVLNVHEQNPNSSRSGPSKKRDNLSQNQRLQIETEKLMNSQESLPQVQVLTADFKTFDSSKNFGVSLIKNTQNSSQQRAVQLQQKGASFLQAQHNSIGSEHSSNPQAPFELSGITSQEEYQFDSQHNSLPNYDISKAEYFSKESGESKSLNGEHTIEEPYESISNPFKSKNLVDASSFLSGDQSMQHNSTKLGREEAKESFENPRKKTESSKQRPNGEDQKESQRGVFDEKEESFKMKNFESEIEKLEKSIRKIEEDYKKRSDELANSEEKEKRSLNGNHLKLTDKGATHYDSSSSENMSDFQSDSSLPKIQKIIPKIPIPKEKQSKSNIRVTFGFSIDVNGKKDFFEFEKQEGIQSIATKVSEANCLGLECRQTLAMDIEKELQRALRLVDQKTATQRGFQTILGKKVIPRSISASCLSGKESQRSSNKSTEESLFRDRPSVASGASRTSSGSGSKCASARPPLVGPLARVDISKKKIQSEATRKREADKLGSLAKKPSSPAERDEVIGSISIQINDGNNKDLLIRKNDKPEILASSFLRTNGLRQTYFPKLVENIKETKQKWLESRDSESSQWSSSKTKTNENFNDLCFETRHFFKKAGEPKGVHGNLKNPNVAGLEREKMSQRSQSSEIGEDSETFEAIGGKMAKEHLKKPRRV